MNSTPKKAAIIQPILRAPSELLSEPVPAFSNTSGDYADSKLSVRDNLRIGAEHSAQVSRQEAPRNESTGTIAQQDARKDCHVISLSSSFPWAL